MRKALKFFLIIALAQACTPFDFGVEHLLRAEVMGQGKSRESSAPAAGDSTSTPAPTIILDTIIYASVVEVPDSYEWARDSSYGAVKARLHFYRDDIEVFSADAGYGKDIGILPESHHLIGEHLYTEACVGKETVICMDGKPSFRWEGNEALKGILPLEDGLISLGIDRNSGKTVLRKDGVPLLNYNFDFILGDFSIPSYGKCGAIYTDGSHFYFHASAKDTFYMVEEGTMSEASLPDHYARIYDMRRIDGKTCILYRIGSGNSIIKYDGKSRLLSGNSYIADGCILASEDGPFCIGTASTGNAIMLGLDAGKYASYPVETHRLYIDGDSVIYPKGISGEERILTYACGQNLGGTLYMGISRTTGKPYIAKNGKAMYTFDVNGYITAIEVIVNQTIL